MLLGFGAQPVFGRGSFIPGLITSLASVFLYYYLEQNFYSSLCFLGTL